MKKDFQDLMIFKKKGWNFSPVEFMESWGKYITSSKIDILQVKNVGPKKLSEVLRRAHRDLVTC